MPVSERLPEPKEWCWVWFSYGNNDGYCDKMFYSEKEGWKKNNLQVVKQEFQNDIVAWQPYYEPEPYCE